ncbi:sigma 54-interacting transcriptional regulator (plasmid) [Lactiplantibacillus plantarum]|uniref:Sigma 54-interacting transcriptional regulator n=1 Tax=Lactiplantibacillus plantarum TaxID=1590 RepID=A0AAX1KE76_LACPN|nr:sigma 54-interacting transcriptional regulator [Lactiplantibacillus plantarum]QQM62631.1 sigma 54-interacting transcriptional regulator [Lactiplantibacillus plantarum]
MQEYVKTIDEFIGKATRQFIASLDEQTILKCNAADLAKVTHKDRSFISRYLNRQVEKHILCKINTRPVLFLDANLLHKETKGAATAVYIYTTFTELLTALRKNSDDFLDIIGHQGSMKNPIEQAKTSLAYPGSGLPMLIFGESGVGKSFFAQKIYDYAKHNQLITASSALVTINCAQYANNPELLSSVLFGYTKGAFTGADQDHEGAFKAAEGGILFLDEVHRLSGEGQEKLFNFLDSGYYTRIGDNSKKITAHVRLICATTEPKTDFLATFLRRLPIQITLPALNQRDLKEKRELIDSFFSEEAERFKQNIEVAGKVFSVLFNFHFSESIGQLKASIKYAVANASVVASKEQIHVIITNLPDWMYQQDPHAFEFIGGTTVTAKYYAATNRIVHNNSQDPMAVLLNKSRVKLTMLDKQTPIETYVSLIKDTMDQIIFNRPSENQDILMRYYINTVKQVLELLDENNDLTYDHNLICGLAAYIYYSELIMQHKLFRDDQSVLLQEKFVREIKIAQRISTVIARQLNYQFSTDELIWMAVYLSTAKNLMVVQNSNLGIILAHGYATASSIANICNRILHSNIFLSINMPINASTDDIVASLKKVIGTLDSQHGIAILVDMGSLKQIAQQAVKYAERPIIVMDKVTSANALEVGKALLAGENLKTISQLPNESWMPKIEICNPPKKRTKVILTVCMTGVGTAQRIKDILQASFIANAGPLIIATDFYTLQKKGLATAELESYDVVCIIGTDNPGITGIPYISLQDLITGERMQIFNQIIAQFVGQEHVDQVNQNLIRNFSLPRVLSSITILDTDKIMNTIQQIIIQLESFLKTRLNNKVKMALFVHVSAMVERLIRNEPIDSNTEMESKLEAQKELYSVIKNSFSVLEEKYRIKITDSEIAYIIDIINFK